MTPTLRDRQFDPPLILDNTEHTVGALAASDCYRITVHCHAPDHFGKALFVLASGREDRLHAYTLSARYRACSPDGRLPRTSRRPETLPDNLGSSEISIEAIRVERYRAQPAARGKVQGGMAEVVGRTDGRLQQFCNKWGVNELVSRGPLSF